MSDSKPSKTELRLKSVCQYVLILEPPMQLSTHIKPITYLKSHTAQIVKDLSLSREPLLITQNGEAKLVVIDIHSYEERENTLAMLKILALGTREIAQDKFKDAEKVFAALDASDKVDNSGAKRKIAKP